MNNKLVKPTLTVQPLPPQVRLTRNIVEARKANRVNKIYRQHVESLFRDIDSNGATRLVYKMEDLKKGGSRELKLFYLVKAKEQNEALDRRIKTLNRRYIFRNIAIDELQESINPKPSEEELIEMRAWKYPPAK